MKLNADHIDLWVFRKHAGENEYLLLLTSQEKADRWFNGSQFWQIPTGAVELEEKVEDAAKRLLEEYGLSAQALWAAEYVYTIYNRRREDVSIIPVFAAEVKDPVSLVLSWEHCDYCWLRAERCLERVRFRGLKEGLLAVRTYISEVATPADELRLF